MHNYMFNLISVEVLLGGGKNLIMDEHVFFFSFYFLDSVCLPFCPHFINFAFLPLNLFVCMIASEKGLTFYHKKV
jgi:hypothetical protein